jgi:hypothetical protein
MFAQHRVDSGIRIIRRQWISEEDYPVVKHMYAVVGLECVRCGTATTDPTFANECNCEPIRYADCDGVVIDESKIPANFRHLIKYAKQWSIGDDAIRGAVMDLVTLEEKKEFVDAVFPLLDEIQNWCSQAHSQGGAIPVEVDIFDTLWEPCSEARLEVYPPRTNLHYGPQQPF